MTIKEHLRRARCYLAELLVHPILWVADPEDPSNRRLVKAITADNRRRGLGRRGVEKATGKKE